MVYDHELGGFVAEFDEQERAKMEAQAEARAERELRSVAEERRTAAENVAIEQAAIIRRLEEEVRRLRGDG